MNYEVLTASVVYKYSSVVYKSSGHFVIHLLCIALQLVVNGRYVIASPSACAWQQYTEIAKLPAEAGWVLCLICVYV